MFGTLIRSRLKRAYPGQPCTLNHPSDYQPKIEVADEFRLSEEDIRFFFENGCLRVIPGTADGIRTIIFGAGEESFYEANYARDYDFSTTVPHLIEMKPCQALIFSISERTIHGSGGNRTPDSRSAFNFRVIRPDTQVY